MPAAGTCAYNFQHLAALGWVMFSTPEWLYLYEPVDAETDPVAFVYADGAWTLWSVSPNSTFCADGAGCGGEMSMPYPDNCDELTDADWLARLRPGGQRLAPSRLRRAKGRRCGPSNLAELRGLARVTT